MNIDLAIIGGSGVYDLEGLSDVQEMDIETPFGNPSDSILIGTLAGTNVAFLPRHGKGHKINPTDVPYRANIFALKLLGVKRIVSVSAVGSLVEELPPRSLVIPDQIIDRTKFRDVTFFDNGIAAHVGFADPFCPNLSNLIHASSNNLNVPHKLGATMIVMEGPAFSTRAESLMYRSWGAHIIGMTALPEAKLAREAEMCYSTMAWVTDYDCWRQDDNDVSVDMVIENLQHNVSLSKSILTNVITEASKLEQCSCNDSLKFGIITNPSNINANVKEKLKPLISKYI
jgi:5'-methylthioadenosine phosphorylase